MLDNRALQPKASPQCPECLKFFMLSMPPKPGSKMKLLGGGETSVPLSFMLSRPHRPIPVSCECGWLGFAVFFEGED